MGDSFAEAFRAEITTWINPRRVARGSPPADPDRIEAANGLLGIAFSGGGMRSASFSLGVAQALARKGLLADADYMSTVSGGGYLGTSLSALCAEPLPYPPAVSRLGFGGEAFPYAFPGPRRGQPPAGQPAPVEGLESPALRHVREHANLLTHAPGLLDAETWTGAVRYAVSTLLMWLLFLLPLVTFGYLISMLIPVDAWDRFDPLNLDGHGPTWISAHLWVLTAPLWPLGVVALLAVSPAWGTLWPEAFMPVPIRYIQQALLVVAAALGAAVLLMLGVWGLHEALSVEGRLESVIRALLAAAGVGGGATAGVSARKLSLPQSATRLLPRIGLAIGGYLLLGLAAVAWYYFLWLWVDGRPLVHVSALAASGLLFAGATLAGVGLLNSLSIHRLYEHRIRRTWVISGLPPWKKKGPDADAQRWSQVWVRPDLKVGDLAASPSEATSPYPMWITALNMPGSTGATLLDRKSDGFVIGPATCGSTITGWGLTAGMRAFRNMKLSTAATISGAAVSPNMGMTTHPTLAIVMTLFNVRLGMWVTNPRRPRDGTERLIGVLHRIFGLYWNELVGRASHRGPWVYLSDGGHFENLGIYELLRRRCRYIVAVDATGEPAGSGPLNFGGIGIPLRMARTDFGVEVKIDLKGLERDPQTGFARTYFAVGRIRYPRAGGGHGDPADPNDPDTGYLVLIKSGLLPGTVPPDIANYRRQENPGFPYDSTLDQQFGQPQFESYRQLGFIAGAAVADAAGTAATTRDRFESMAAAYTSDIA